VSGTSEALISNGIRAPLASTPCQVICHQCPSATFQFCYRVKRHLGVSPLTNRASVGNVARHHSRTLWNALSYFIEGVFAGKQPLA
jgi:hypothetical protein